MEQFEKWWGKEYRPSDIAKSSWRAALEEILKQIEHFNSDGSVIDWINKELGDT